MHYLLRKYKTIIVFVFAILLSLIIVNTENDIEPETTVKAETTIEASTTTEVSTTRAEPETALDSYEIELIARTIWGEAEGVKNKAEQAAVAWCILNRVDAYGQTIEQVVKAPNQFHGYYRVKGKVPEYFWFLAADVMNRWNAEKKGTVNVGRVLPSNYLYFIGDGNRNHFSIKWRSNDYWDWSLDSPY